MTSVSHGKPCAGNPHARFEEGASALESPRRNALLHADFDVKTGYSVAFRTFVDFAQKTQSDGYNSANAKATLDGRQLTVSAMGLGVKGKNAKGEEILCGPGAMGKRGVSCVKTIGGVIGYVVGGHTFYVIDTTKIPVNAKAWDMENTILKNGLLTTDESKGEVNVSYIPKMAIIGHVYIPAKSNIDIEKNSDKCWSTVKNIATGWKYMNLKIVFNPEYKP